MYESGPSQEEMALLGFGIDDIAEQGAVEVWPENWTAVQAFTRLATQWVVGPGGPIGLNYCSIPVVFDALGIRKRKEKEDTFEALRVLESEALRQMNNGK